MSSVFHSQVVLKRFISKSVDRKLIIELLFEQKLLPAFHSEDFVKRKKKILHFCHSYISLSINALALFYYYPHPRAPFVQQARPSHTPNNTHHSCSGNCLYHSVFLFFLLSPSHRYTRTPLSFSLCLRVPGRRLPRKKTVKMTVKRMMRKRMSRRQRVRHTTSRTCI